MSEIKHTFQAGKMNKDLDERLVPQGEYRDALNIEVRTSDGSDVGTAQTLHGNKERVNDADFSEVNPTVSWTGIPSRFVGSVADGKADRAYFFIASPKPSVFDSTKVTATKLYKDMIVMYDNVAKTLKPVVTDIFRVEFTNITSGVANNHIEDAATVYDFIDIPTTVGNDNIRAGMRGRVYDTNGALLPNFSVADSDDSNTFTVREVKYTTLTDTTNVWRIYLTTTVTGVLTDAKVWTFEADKVLNFTNTDPYNVLITGINVIDNLLLWTDNKSEPKKINIDRRIGKVNDDSESFESHSRLKIVKPGTVDTLEYALSAPLDPGLKEEHITVIRRAPRTSLRLEMSSFEDGVELDITGSVVKSFVDGTGDPIVVGSEIDVEISGIENIPAGESDETYSIGFQYTAGQIVILENDSTPGETLTIRAVVISAQWNSDNTVFNHTLRINSIDSSITSGHEEWTTSIEQAKPLFEFNLGRFSYRYKYQDGEYSSFAPWSELAFLPGKQDYVPSKGYNLGMVNTVRYLRVTDFVVDDYQRPDDIVEVDVLYKDTVSPNVRVVKSIKKNVDPEWNDNSDIGGNSGVINISSEMMHRTLPSSQILRAWDNVPKLALAQEVTGNRLVYGNYLQNFNIGAPVVVSPSILSVDHSEFLDGDDVLELMPVKSLKSIRKYKIGVVFGDKYGRETPVMGIGGETDGTVVIPSSIAVEKINSSKVNQIQASLSWGSGNPDSWMEYYKYYVKETTNEYYNLVLHRWYNAEDGNVWLAFSSADRNKVDEETYITLKNVHGGETAVMDEARYKILAIENEAPDFVKITEKGLGSKMFSAIIGEAGDNDVSEIAVSMVVDFQASFNDDIFNDISFKGTGFARITAVKDDVQVKSKWVGVSSIEMGTSALQFVKTAEPWGVSAELWDHFGVEYNDPGIDWGVDMMDAVVENKPEFDGRFFVKVLRDGVLSTNIMATTSDSVTYNIVDTFNFSSVDTKNINGKNPANPDADYKGDYKGIASTATPEVDRTDFLWNNGTSGFVIAGNSHGQVKFNYGCTDETGGGEETKDFWEKTKYTIGRGWIMDGSNRATSWSGESDYHQTPLGGLRTSGGVSKIDFSSTAPGKEVSDSANNFKLAMTPGTLFRFLSDPLDQVYRVTDVDSNKWHYNFHQKRLAGLECVLCDTKSDNHRWDYCYRNKFTLSFVNVVDSSPLNTGLWDPRSAMRNDGTESSKIVIVEPSFNDGSILDFKEGNAIWETEPKEDVGLDLYYEATDALPIKLSQENIESYCPTESPITVYRPGANLNPVTVANAPVVNTAVRDVVGVRDFTSGGVFPFQIALKDTLKFTHADGGATEAEVIDHMYPIPLYANTYGNSDAAGGSEDRSSGYTTATYKSSFSIALPCTVAEISTVTIDDSTTGTTDGVEIFGCIDQAYLEYNSSANVDDGSCVTLVVYGCMDADATNYNADANEDDGSCEYAIDYCSDPNSTTPPNVGCRWNANDGSVETTGNGTVYNGFVVKRDEGVSEGDPITGFMVMMSDMDEGNKKNWDDWYDYFAYELNDNSTIEWPDIDQLELIESVRNEYLLCANNTSCPDLNDFVNFNNASYWSSSGYLLNASNLHFYNGIITESSPKLNELRVRGIIPFTYTPPGKRRRLGTSRTLTSELALVSSAPGTFYTGTNGEKWEAISATNTVGGASFTLPVGTFITNIADDNTLTYNTTNGDSIGIGSHTITFQKVTGYYKLDSDVYGNKTTLPWFNCYSFGNGLESDRIRDDYNAPQIDNGVKVSTLLDSYGEERRGSGMIYSGIYNSTSGVNNLNEFNMAGKITKDLNPSYGSIQALKTRDTNVVAFCEDKVFKILANKDALYNADGSINLVASDRVLGSATAFAGEYGISSNPESLAVDGYRMYFTDKQRNKVLRLSQDGMTPISDIGMNSWFRDNLNNSKNVKKQELIGTFDDIKGEYNLSLRHLDTNGITNADKADITVSFNERSKGWSSFKSFVPETGLSINDEYLTGKIAKLWSHHSGSVNANTFYGEDLVPSTIDVLFNENPGSVKSFLAMNYEGSQAKINEFTTKSVDGETYNDGEYYNLKAKTGWYVDSFNTDLQEAQVPDFKQKEGKWFNYISGVKTDKKNLDTSEFSVQGIGVLASSTIPTVTKVNLTIRENND